MGLFERAIAPLLSQRRMVGSEVDRPSSQRKRWSQVAFRQDSLTVIYLALVVEQATVFCLHEDQEKMTPLREKQ